MTMKKVTKITYSIVVIMLVSACSKSWLDETPPHVITTETLYTNLNGFEAGLNGLYSLVRAEREGRDGAADNRQADIALLGTGNMVPNPRGRIGFIALEGGARHV